MTDLLAKMVDIRGVGRVIFHDGCPFRGQVNVIQRFTEGRRTVSVRGLCAACDSDVETFWVTRPLEGQIRS